MTFDAEPVSAAPAVGDERRVRRLAMITAMAAIGPLSVVGVAVTAPSWWEGVVAASAYVLTLGVLRDWSLEGYPRRAMFALTFTGVMWGVGSISLTSPVSFVPFSLVGALLLARTSARRRWMVAFAGGVAGIGACALLVHPVTWQLTFFWVITPAVGTVFISGVILLSEHIWQLVRRLERARETEAELAVANERVRFAGDLHDIQGHSLHVIKLKATLAERVMRIDPDRSRTELAEILRLTDETIAQTRTLAYARHTLNLPAELENARQLCEAAGIAVRVQTSGAGADLAHAHPLLAQVLREATTNLLRHADATTVTVVATPVSLLVTNDGATGTDGPQQGISRLRGRIEQAGGQLTVHRTAAGFSLGACMEVRPEGGPQTPSPSARQAEVRS